jgi:hypothetical protein
MATISVLGGLWTAGAVHTQTNSTTVEAGCGLMAATGSVLGGLWTAGAVQTQTNSRTVGDV